jgi:hypothetical protein
MWKTFIDNYEISSTGKVKNITTNKLLKLDKNGKGLLRVTIKRKHFLIHRLVAEAFIKNPLNYPQVTFKRPDKENVTMENLEWCNYQNARIRPTMRKDLKGNVKLTPGMVTAIRFNKKTSAKDCALMYSVSVSTIYAIRKGKNIKRICNSI